MTLSAVILALLVLPVRADEFSDLFKRAKESAGVAVPEGKVQEPPSCTDGITARAGKFCENVADCMKFCSCACVFDSTKWKSGSKDDGSTTCGASMPDTGVGMLPADSALLLPAASLPFVSVAAGVTATQDVLDGLRRLSDKLASPANANRIRHGYTVRVANCYRPHREDSVRECGFTLKAKHMLAKDDLDEKARASWERKANPQNLGLAWPGRTPHSGGYACDMILVDAAGRDCFDWRAGVAGSPSCSIEQQVASSLMDEEVAGPETGGRRLRYEAWHYEFGPGAKGCVHPDCAANWPLTGSP